MQIFNSGILWFVEGILLCLVIVGIRAFAEERSILMTAWKWGAVLGWLGLTGFTIAFIGTSIGEGEPTAAVRGGALFGIVVLLSGATLWRFIRAGAGRDGRQQSPG